MRKALFKIGLLAAVLAAAACTKEVQIETPVAPEIGEQMTFTAVAAGHTKTVVENGSSVYWSPGDQIKIFYGSENSGKFTSSNTEPTAKATFSGVFENFEGTINVGEKANDFWAVYPYSKYSYCDGSSVSVEVVAEQTGMAGTFAPELFPAVAKSPNLLLPFWNLCGGVKFTVNHSDIQKVVFKGNNNETLAGNFKVGMDSQGHPAVLSVLDSEKEVSVAAPNGGCFTPGVEYYMVLRPVVLSKGFTMTFVSASGTIEYNHDTSVEIKRSVFGVLEGKDGATPANVMSGANSFIISQYGPASFDARYKGNSQETVGSIASTEVLWESFGTDVQPEVGDIVKNVSVKDGIVSFTASGKDGNAVIAVKDAAGDILWSWHIWVCQGYDPDATAQVYYNNAGTVMDRNLGATSAAKGDVKALGLLYQWGRKDPFLGSSSISSIPSPSRAKSTWGRYRKVTSDASTGTIDYVVKNPTVFVTYNTHNFDWYYTGSSETDNTRWNSEKGMYDPCPKGWKVPAGGNNGLWATAAGLSSSSYRGFDRYNCCMDFSYWFCESPNVWYPASGYLYIGDGSLDEVGEYGYYWSYTAEGSKDFASHFRFDEHGIASPVESDFRATGSSVRCVKQ